MINVKTNWELLKDPNTQWKLNYISWNLPLKLLLNMIDKNKFSLSKDLKKKSKRTKITFVLIPILTIK